MGSGDKKSDSQLESKGQRSPTQAGDSLSNELLNDQNASNENRLTDQSSEDRPNEDRSADDQSDSAESSADDQQNYESKCGQPDNPGDDFSSADWLDLLDNREIFKRILFTKNADPHNPTQPRPARGAKATINLETKLYSTQQPITSESYACLEVIVGDYDVIHGIDLILPMMHLYEKSRVVISPRFGYGDKGRLPDVPPNSRLDCTVELLAIQDDLEELSNDEKISLGKLN